MKRFTPIFLFIFFCSLALSTEIAAQKIIEFANASFEGISGEKSLPEAWYSCLGPDDVNPDIHSSRSNIWRVRQREMHGLSFVGMRVTEEGQLQSISTELLSPLEENSYYEFSLDLAKPETMLVTEQSLVTDNNQERGQRRGQNSKEFNKPIILQIWASNSPCQFTEIVAQTSPIFHIDWRTYKIRFKTREAWKYLHFVASYIVEETYNGALFIDNVSPIAQTDSVYSPTEIQTQRFQDIQDYLTELRSGDSNNRLRVTNDMYIKEDIRKGKEIDRSILYDFSILGEVTKYEINRRGVRNGEAMTYDLATGMEKKKLYFEDDQLHGWQYSYYDNGENESVMKYDRGKKVGPHTHYYENGNLMIKVDWGKGDFVKNILEFRNVKGELIDVRDFRKNFIEYFIINEDLTISFYLPLKSAFETFDLKEPI